jgi:hypothetical protein
VYQQPAFPNVNTSWAPALTQPQQQQPVFVNGGGFIEPEPEAAPPVRGGTCYSPETTKGIVNEAKRDPASKPANNTIAPVVIKKQAADLADVSVKPEPQLDGHTIVKKEEVNEIQVHIKQEPGIEAEVGAVPTSDIVPPADSQGGRVQRSDVAPAKPEHQHGVQTPGQPPVYAGRKREASIWPLGPSKRAKTIVESTGIWEMRDPTSLYCSDDDK